MNVDRILSALAAEQADFILIGGMNFLLRHSSELTFDVDIWVRDDDRNLKRLNRALRVLEAAWGETEAAWGPIPEDWGWLRRQSVYCLTTREGALDVFREVCGLEGRCADCRMAAAQTNTPTGVPYLGLSDQHMMDCQMVAGRRSKSKTHSPVDRGPESGEIMHNESL